MTSACGASAAAPRGATSPGHRPRVITRAVGDRGGRGIIGGLGPECSRPGRVGTRGGSSYDPVVQDNTGGGPPGPVARAWRAAEETPRHEAARPDPVMGCAGHDRGCLIAGALAARRPGGPPPTP